MPGRSRAVKIVSRKRAKVRRMYKRKYRYMAHGIWRSMNPNNNVYSFTRRMTGSSFSAVGLSPHYVGYTPVFGNMPGYTEFTSLFDQFRLEKVRYTIAWQASTISVIEAYNNNFIGQPILYYYVDLDDATTPTSINELREVQKCKVFYFSASRRTKTITFTPTILQQLYKTSISTGYAPVKNVWVDVADAQTLQHFGLKYAVYVPGSNAAPLYFDVEIQFVFSCRNPR